MGTHTHTLTLEFKLLKLTVGSKGIFFDRNPALRKILTSQLAISDVATLGRYEIISAKVKAHKKIRK